MDRPTAADCRAASGPIPRARAWLRRQTGYDAVRIALGLLLLTAAALKGHQLATEPTAETSLLTSRWFLIAVVEFELFFGLWLLAGLYAKWTWRVALLCFSGFACVAFYKALSGEASCGCFGRVAVNPWYTAGLDVAVVIGLLRWRPDRVLTRAADGLSLHMPTATAVVTGLWLVLGVPAAVAMASFDPALLTSEGDIFGDSEIVVLQPEKWVGKRFPLSDHIDIGDQLMRDEWIVVLHYHDCPKCQEARREYEALARDLADQPDAARVALIEMPPYDPAPPEVLPHGSLCVQGQLSNVREWFVEAPVEIHMSQGVVRNVSGRKGPDERIVQRDAY